MLALAEVQQEPVSSAPEAYEELITLHPRHVSVRVSDGNYYTLQITGETRRLINAGISSTQPLARLCIN